MLKQEMRCLYLNDNHIENDTIELLKECNAGVKTAVTSIDEVFDTVDDPKLMKILSDSKEYHEKLGDETHVLLERYHDREKDPNPMAKAMSWMKINMKLLQKPTNHEVADLITDGCNMGTKSLTKYLNQYKAASEEVKDIAKRLIAHEEGLIQDIREFL